MSLNAINWAYKQRLPQLAQSILACIAHHANDEGLAWPSISVIADETGACRRSVELAIQTLEEAGLVSRRSTPWSRRTFSLPVGEVFVTEKMAPKRTSGRKSACEPASQKCESSSHADAAENTNVVRSDANVVRTKCESSSDITTINYHELPSTPIVPEASDLDCASTAPSATREDSIDALIGTMWPAEPAEPSAVACAPVVLPAGTGSTSTPVTKPDVAIPDWVPAEAWNGFMEMRKAKRVKETPHAIKLLVKKLSDLRAAGHAPGAVLDQSTMRNWTGLFEIKDTRRSSAKPSRAGWMLNEIMEDCL